MPISPYVIGFLSLAAVPLALAAYGAHLTVILADRAKHRRALSIIWSLAVLGVGLAALQQVDLYRSDAIHVAEQKAMQTQLNESALSQEHIKTQLSTLAVVMGTLAQSRGDPAFKQLSSVVTQMSKASSINMLASSVMRQQNGDTVVNVVLENFGDVATTAHITAEVTVDSRSVPTTNQIPDQLAFSPHQQQNLNLPIALRDMQEAVWSGKSRFEVRVDAEYNDGKAMAHYVFIGRLNPINAGRIDTIKSDWGQANR